MVPLALFKPHSSECGLHGLVQLTEQADSGLRLSKRSLHGLETKVSKLLRAVFHRNTAFMSFNLGLIAASTSTAFS